MEQITVNLSEVLVDPRLSPRRVPVDDDFLARLAEVLADGGELPPLRVARLSDRTAPWCSGQAPQSRRARVEYLAVGRQLPWSNLRSLPELVLIDGLSSYWALMAAGRKTAPAEVLAEPVSEPREVTALAYQANLRHGRRLDDRDQQVVFVRFWLGREVRDGHESWTPAADGLGAVEAAARLGHGPAWATKMQAWVQVEQVTQLPLRLTCGYALSRLPEGDWYGFCWLGAGADRAERRHPYLDDALRPVSGEAPRPVRELPRVQIERHVQRLMLAAERGEVPEPLPQPVKPAQGAFDFGPEWQPTYTGELPRKGYDEVRETVVALQQVAATLSLDQLRDSLLEVLAVEADVADGRRYLEKVARAHRWSI